MMGGCGSGRRGGRNLTDDFLRLDVRKLQRAGVLQPGWRGSWQWMWRSGRKADILIEASESSIRLRYTNPRNGQRKDYDYRVRLSRSTCHYGGSRPWFVCPACGRRVAILYGGSVYACRRCHQLAYESQRETSGDRAIRKADAIRRRLGWPAGIALPMGDRPKNMRHTTYLRLLQQYNALVQIGLEGIRRDLGLVNARLDGAQRRLKAI